MGAKRIHKYNYVLGRGTNVTTKAVLQRWEMGSYLGAVRQKSKHETLLSIARHRLYTFLLRQNSTEEAKLHNGLV